MWPAAAGVVAFAVGTALSSITLTDSTWVAIAWPGDSGSASTLIQVVASSVITVTTLTFSLTVLALQLASQQFSPRLLRQFTRDPVTRVVLAVLVGTFTLAITVLRHVRSDSPVPHLAVLAVTVAGLVSLAAIEAFYPRYGDDRPRDPDGTTPVGAGHVVAAARSGFVRMVDVDALVSGATEQDAVVQLITRPGDHVTAGTPLGVAWDRGVGCPRDCEAVEAVVRGAVELGYERTLDQDSAFGFRQLQDIAVKDLSPGINDPVTAAHALGYTADLLVQVLGCRLGATAHEDSEGVVRAVVPDRDLGYYLDLSCDQVRRYGSREPTVLIALLRMLRDAAVACRDDDQRAAIAAQAQRILDTRDDALLPHEAQSVTDMAARVEAALDGHVVDAYNDRSGETRSI